VPIVVDDGIRNDGLRSARLDGKSAAAADREPAMSIVTTLDHLVLNVRDVEASAAWYERVLGMTRHDFKPSYGVARTSMKFGGMMLNLRPVDMDKATWFTGAEAVAGSDDLCFLTESSPEDVIRHLTACGVPVEVGPVGRRGARGEMTSVYCRDPDGNLIEVARYAGS
jgi:catechol 2,3-dioxygenase-like lactoylglutathione lyase family enzyme